MPTQKLDLAIALLHHPVVNKLGETIGSAVTNLDLHDISRTARTYGVRDYFVATPYKDQLELIEEITEHWQNGHGASANPARKEALALVRPVDGFETIIQELARKFEKKVLVELLQDTGARSFQMDVRGPWIAEGDFNNRFGLDLALKDVRLGCEMARAWGLDLKTMEAVLDLYKKASADGFGKEDCNAVFKVVGS